VVVLVDKEKIVVDNKTYGYFIPDKEAILVVSDETPFPELQGYMLRTNIIKKYKPKKIVILDKVINKKHSIDYEFLRLNCYTLNFDDGMYYAIEEQYLDTKKIKGR